MNNTWVCTLLVCSKCFEKKLLTDPGCELTGALYRYQTDIVFSLFFRLTHVMISPPVI